MEGPHGSYQVARGAGGEKRSHAVISPASSPVKCWAAQVAVQRTDESFWREVEAMTSRIVTRCTLPAVYFRSGSEVRRPLSESKAELAEPA